MTIDTDASDTAWGATLLRTATTVTHRHLTLGWWKGLMVVKMYGTRMTSNEHELWAVERTLRQGFRVGMIRHGDDILLRSDSTTIVFNINRQAACFSL
jgi:hypothetical protein